MNGQHPTITTTNTKHEEKYPQQLQRQQQHTSREPIVVIVIIMGRKSKQAGTGHLPLTNHEIKAYSKDAYGTTSARLGQDSQYAFANCCLSLHPAKDRPVATPSGFIYERSAILEYMLAKTQELKKEQQQYELWRTSQERDRVQSQEKDRKDQLEAFENSQRVVMREKRKVELNPLKRTSYWLAESQPDMVVPIGRGGTMAVNNNNIGESNNGIDGNNSNTIRLPPPRRPCSPNSQQPLHLKGLIELDLQRNSNDQVLCAISEKCISTQQAVALITKSGQPAQVVLEQIYTDLGKVRVCPITGRKIIQILKLQRGGSSFASNGGANEAKKYRPTMT
jgi:nitric oxide synthase-interacting protein